MFPSVTLWWGKLAGSRGPVIAFVGSFGPIDIDSEATDRRIERLGLSMDVDPSIARTELVVDHFVGRWDQTSGSTSVALNRDEFPVVEFSTPVSNRDRKLISGAVFEDYYQRVLSNLEMQGVTVDSRSIVNPCLLYTSPSPRDRG